MRKNEQSRRDFMKQSSAAAATAGILSASSFAVAGDAKPKIRVGAIGVGGRGTGAMKNIREAANLLDVKLEFVSVADVFDNRANQAGGKFGIPEKHRFVGFDAYRKLLEVPMDVVLMATPPNFRPVHFKAAVKAGRHCFIEKPVAVDAPGARSMYAVGEKADSKGLSVVAGTQRRHKSGYIANAQAIHDGAIGRILGGKVMWCWGRPLWVRDRKDGQSNAEYLANNWGNFVEMSGDHILEQHVHNIDVANWYIGHPPRTALGYGGRARRRSGNQYDFFSVNFDYGDNCDIHSMCNQIKGAYSRTGEWFSATEGNVVGGGNISRFDDADVERPDISVRSGNPYVQEHVALLQSVLEEKGANETKHVVDATLTAIMGRISAYTGQIVRWTDLTENSDSKWYDKKLTPTAEDFEKGEVPLPKEGNAPVPGKA